MMQVPAPQAGRSQAMAFREQQPLPQQDWTPQALEAYELSAYQSASNKIADLASRVRIHSMTAIANIQWSDILVPWLWLAAHAPATDRFPETLAELAQDARDEATTLVCSEYIRELWGQTQFGFRALGIQSALALAEWLAGHRHEMLRWMAGDSRYRHLAHQALATTSALGAHLEDYEQEFLIHQLTMVGAQRFHLFGAILGTMVAHVAQNFPSEPQESNHRSPGHQGAASQPDPIELEEPGRKWLSCRPQRCARLGAFLGRHGPLSMRWTWL